MTAGDTNPFTSAESYYANHRPGYGDRAIDYLVTRFDLDGARVLDLGCGAGQVTIPLAAHAGAIVGMDPNEVHTLVGEYLDDLPERTGPVEYNDPWDELIAEFGFQDTETVSFEFEREWDVGSIVGYVFSLSYCSLTTFGNDKANSERALRARLDPDETVVEDAVVTVVASAKFTSRRIESGFRRCRVVEACTSWPTQR